jgi:hypothetical protein
MTQTTGTYSASQVAEIAAAPGVQDEVNLEQLRIGMTPLTIGQPGASERRTRVEGNRVACWRIGSVELDRCRECLYLVRLEGGASSPQRQPTYVLCADAAVEAEVDFAW